MRTRFALLWLTLAASSALAQEMTADDAGTPGFEVRLKELEATNALLRRDLDALRGDHDYVEERVQALLPLSAKVSGYVDVGLFFAFGNGSGIQADLGYANFPEYGRNVPLDQGGGVPDTWLFMGDPLSTAINSRGEPADTGDSRAVTFNPVGNKGALSFLVNALNLALFTGVGTDLTVNAVVEFVPRGRNVSDGKGLFLGDFLDVKLAYAEYIVPIDAFSLSLFAGKMDPVLGIEYRIQESPDRFSVTPSLICRYTCGRPVGVKARGKFFSDSLALAIAVTNGSSVVESFPFSSEIDTNFFKTASGRLSWKFPIGAGLEIGVSGSIGAQDFQTRDDIMHEHVGADLHLIDFHGIDVSAEYVRGNFKGATNPGEARCGSVPCLRYQGAYGQLAYRVTNWLIPYARVDFRDALHRSGASFLYVSNLMRVTAGVRFEVGTNTVFKAEYTLNQELGKIPQFPNDVLTTSLVVSY